MRNGLSLFEEQFCQLMALGKTGREAYAEAFGRTPKRPDSFDRRIGYLVRRADVASRVEEIREERRRALREKFARTGEEIVRNLGEAVLSHQRSGLALESGAIKGAELFLKATGNFAPETTVLKDGGRAEGYVPRGVEAMTDEDLLEIARGGAVEAECEVLPPDGRGGASDAPEGAEGGRGGADGEGART